MVPQDPPPPDLPCQPVGGHREPVGVPITGAQRGGVRERGSNDPPPPRARKPISPQPCHSVAFVAYPLIGHSLWWLFKGFCFLSLICVFSILREEGMFCAVWC